MEQKELICIGCPMGCMLQVTLMEGEVTEVTGNTCKRGEAYARKEVTNPTRILTSSVRVQGGELPVVSVKTREDIPKGKIRACMEALRETEIAAPVSIGDVVLKNIAGTGVDMVATKPVAKCLRGEEGGSHGTYPYQ